MWSSRAHLSASSELLVSGFNCFDWCLRWKHLVLAVTACTDFFRLLQTPYSTCCLSGTQLDIITNFFLQNFFLNKYNHFVFYFASKILSIAQEHMWRYTNCLSTIEFNDICFKRYECLTLVLYIFEPTQYQGFSLTNKVHEKTLQRQLIWEREGDRKRGRGMGRDLILWIHITNLSTIKHNGACYMSLSCVIYWLHAT